MLSRELIPIENDGSGNCVFISLAQIVFGDPSKFEFVRYMIVHRLRSFPEKYRGKQQKFSDYCNNMSKNGEAASHLELQAIADICFAVVECYSTKDFFKPVHTILPLRFTSECESCIRLWVGDGHCMALSDE